MDDNFQGYRQTVQGMFAAVAMTAAIAHARSEFPRESCGLIVSGEYVPCVNYATDPLSDFQIAPEAYLRASQRGTIEAVVHSHPNGQVFPSQIDMKGQIDTGVPWIILPLNEDVIMDPVAWGDQLPMAPMLNRPFVWGVFDCYSLIRDYYRTNFNLSLPNVPREDEWWNKGEDLYLDHLKPQGFREIQLSEAKPGDGFLIRFMGSSKLNHAGVLLPNSLILHHLPTRLSRREPAGIWARAADMWVRHEAING
jgi:proteasome lid subunit RPN8/RPN11